MGRLQDDDLDRALDTWSAPSPPAGIEAKALAAYRAEFREARGWRGLVSMRVAIPLPVLVVALLGIVSLSIMVFRLEAGRSAPAAVESNSPWGGLQPVSELRPVILRSPHEAH
jgi:uncharacterized membrane protein YdfJ with MMPL/SSD domain